MIDLAVTAAAKIEYSDKCDGSRNNVTSTSVDQCTGIQLMLGGGTLEATRLIYISFISICVLRSGDKDGLSIH